MKLLCPKVGKGLIGLQPMSLPIDGPDKFRVKLETKAPVVLFCSSKILQKFSKVGFG